MSPRDILPPDCPEFEYKHHPEHAAELPRRVAKIVKGLRSRTIDALASASDTRPMHGTLFQGLTPTEHPYFAGHYRGEEFRCLLRYEVQAGKLQGCKSELVPTRMTLLGKSICGAIAALDAGYAQPSSIVSEEIKLLHIVQTACRYFMLVGQIHPYANGNGHAARFCLWAILARYGYFPNRWPISPRQPDPHYAQLVLAYENGNKGPLERHILQCLT